MEDSISGRDKLEEKKKEQVWIFGGETERGWGGNFMEKQDYIATCVNIYQLISSEFLSSLKHSPKVDCGRDRRQTRELGTLGKDLS